ncbi:hypothetical protein nbrc107696_31150 [Gordonia spumicola]|uniref:NUDIX hydrolase n=2 Tax=Gordonia spumicola TaxID=589161 RepID=A0A7I9VBD5_9ACTN|nr:hypothetical protein nbrc107696_31150 [Gordonia spumicola]
MDHTTVVGDLTVATLLTGVGVAAGVLLIVGLIWFAILSSTRASRLRRLDVRVELARGALVHALDRRAAIASDLADIVADEQRAHAVRITATVVRSAGLADRERDENVLSAAIAQVDAGPCRDDLVDAQTRVTIARRFYNDAVRDARALRGRRMVRWLRLGPSTPRPDYFEIAERVTPA